MSLSFGKERWNATPSYVRKAVEVAGAPTMMNNDNCAYFTLEIEAISTFRSVINYEVSDFRNVLSPGGHKHVSWALKHLEHAAIGGNVSSFELLQKLQDRGAGNMHIFINNDTFDEMEAKHKEALAST